MFKPINLLKAFALVVLCLGYQVTSAQESAQLPHGVVKIMASDITAGTAIAPPDGFVPGEDRAVTFNVTYTGFTAAAQTAFQYAVDIWASLLTGGQTINVDANFTALGPGILGSAGPDQVFRDFAGAPVAGTWYPEALADQLAGSDLDPGGFDINANFSNTFGFYFGTDGNPGPGEYDFVSVVLHELGHGVGFLSVTDVTAGLGYHQFLGFPYIYDDFVENGAGSAIHSFVDGSAALATQLTSDDIFFDGPNCKAANGGVRAPLYAPATWNGGSSISHFNDADYPAGDPNSLMTHAIGAQEVIHSPGSVALGVLEDIGWTLDTGCQLWYIPDDYTASTSEPMVFACAAPAGYSLAADQFCAEDLANNDPYCVNTDFDALCQSQYNCCIGVAPGCYDFFACNYDILNISCTDNSVCTYPGCTDSNACNYDASAGCDDGSCTYPGCTNIGAVNYDATAGCDDGSCCFASEFYQLVVTGGTFPLEIGWTLVDQDGVVATGGAPSTTNICNWTNVTCLGIFMTDSFGDSWNGGTWTLYDAAGNVVSSGTHETGASSYDDVLGGCTVGCTNPFACNYDASAGIDDGSCNFPGCTDATACNYDASAGCDDGGCTYDANCLVACITAPQSAVGVGFTGYYDPSSWAISLAGNGSVDHNNSTLVLQGTNESVDLNGNYDSGNSEATILASLTGDYSFDWDYTTNDGPSFEVAYYINGVRIDLTDVAGGLIQAGSVTFSANAGDVIGFGIESTDGCCGDGHAKFYNFTYPAYICGCMDATACNYDPLATFDDGSCTYPGCTDPLATNYDPAAGCDNGTCCFAPAAYYLVVTGGTFPGEISWNVSNEDGPIASGGAPSQTNLCMDAQLCLYIEMFDSFGDGWNGGQWELYDGFGTLINSGTLAGGSSGSAVMMGGCTPGCTNPYACNYDPAAGVDDGSCNFPGCTDANACNWSPSASCDDGSCVYDTDDCSNACVAFTGASQGHGFTAYYAPGSWTFDNVGNGNSNFNASSLVLKGTNEYWDPNGNYDFQSGETQVSILAATTGTYNFEWAADFSQDGPPFEIAYYINGVRVDLSDVNGSFMQSGAVSFPANEGDLIGFGIESTDGCCGEGYAHFFNFNWPLPTCGCTDPNACNYDASAEYDDGCCHYQFGCMDPTAINYNSYALCDDGLCAWLDECGNLVDLNGDSFNFSGEFAPGNWTIDTGAGDGTVAISLSSMTIVGNNDTFAPDNTLTQASITLTQSGTVSFNWDYSTTDAGPNFDPAYYINNVPVFLTNNAGLNQQNGSVMFAANAGDIIGFGIDSTDGCCGEATLVISDFSGPQEGCTPGCTESAACNYDPLANDNDGSCEYLSCAGCTYPDAPEYDPAATIDDGTCTCPAAGGCQGDFNGDLVINTTDLLGFLSVFGTTCP